MRVNTYILKSSRKSNIPLTNFRDLSVTYIQCIHRHLCSQIQFTMRTSFKLQSSSLSLLCTHATCKFAIAIRFTLLLHAMRFSCETKMKNARSRIKLKSVKMYCKAAYETAALSVTPRLLFCIVLF